MPVTETWEGRGSPSGIVSPDTTRVSFAPLNDWALEWPLQMQFGGLLDGELFFRKPLQVNIYRDGQSYVAKCTEVDQFGCCADLAEALDDLGRTLSEMYRYLSEANHAETRGDSLKEQYALLCCFIGRRHHAHQTA